MRDGDASTNGSEIGAYSNDMKRVMMLAGNYYKDPYLKQEAMRSNSYLQNFAYGHGNTSPVEFLSLMTRIYGASALRAAADEVLWLAAGRNDCAHGLERRA